MKVLQVEDIEKSKKRKKILKGLSFSVDEQEIVGLLGPNGSGKSTTIKCISGLYRTDRGRMRICGNAALRLLVHQLLKRFRNNARICGHRDLSPDRNGDGVVEPEEWVKECPCFEVSKAL